MSIQDTIKTKLDQLEQFLINGEHLNQSEVFAQQLSSLSLYYHLMRDEDRDYVNCAKTAWEESLEWKI
jgi:hypothetical protein